MMHWGLHYAVRLGSIHKRCKLLYPVLTSQESFSQAKDVPSRQYSLSSWSSFISSSTPVLTMQDFLVQIHGMTNLPWWAVVGLTTFCFRSVVAFPLAVHQHQVVARLANLRKELDEIKVQLHKEVTIYAREYNWDLKRTKKVFRINMRSQYQKLIIRDNCHPFKVILTALVQIPVWVCLSISLRNLSFMLPHHDTVAEQIHQQLKVEGVFCFSDLTVPSTLFIPVLLIVVNITLIEMHSLRKAVQSSLLEKVLLNGSRCMTVFLAIFATLTPSCVSFYWLCSSTFGLLQNTALLMPRVRRTLRIPHTLTESATPFQDIRNNLRAKVISKAQSN